MNQVFQDIYKQIWGEIFPDLPILNIDKFIRLYTTDLHLPTPRQCAITGETVYCGQEYRYKKFISEKAILQRDKDSNNTRPKRNINSLNDLLNNLENIALFKGSRQLNSEVIEESDDIYSSSYIFNCVHCYSCQKMLYCSNNRACEYIMASSGNGECSFGIKLKDSGSITNSFDMHWCGKSANCYFCANTSDLRDCMFCFSLVSKQYCIGNMQFEKEEYLKLKQLLLNQYLQQLSDPNPFVSIEDL